MTFPSILALAVGLSMDAAAVAATRGLIAPAIRLRDMLSVALFFGGFQAGMPLLGWLIGSQVGHFVEAFDHWIAFGLLAALGGKMLHEAITADKDEPARTEPAPFRPRLLLVLAIATSIDAFAVGITLPMLDAPLGLSLLTIGLTTAVLSGLALHAGRRFGALLGRRLDAFGGLVLVALGVRILVEHLTASPS